MAVIRNVAPSTQNQALAALLFLYREVLDIDLPLAGWYHPRHEADAASDGARVAEVQRLLAHLEGSHHLIASLLYGSGLRLMDAQQAVEGGTGQIGMGELANDR